MAPHAPGSSGGPRGFSRVHNPKHSRLFPTCRLNCLQVAIKCALRGAGSSARQASSPRCHPASRRRLRSPALHQPEEGAQPFLTLPCSFPSSFLSPLSVVHLQPLPRSSVCRAFASRSHGHTEGAHTPARAAQCRPLAPAPQLQRLNQLTLCVLHRTGEQLRVLWERKSQWWTKYSDYSSKSSLL